MAVDGTYNITVQTPMGAQQSKVTLKTDGNSLSGTDESAFGTTSFTGTVSGDEVQWEETVKSPMGELKISFKGTVEGDKISGQATTPFGPSPFEGTRA
jgi:uncharacterized protein YjdB